MARRHFLSSLSRESILSLRALDLYDLFAELSSDSIQMFEFLWISVSRLLTMPGDLYRIFFGHVPVSSVQRPLIRVTAEGQNSYPHECSDRDRYSSECSIDLGILPLASNGHGNNLGSHTPLLLHSRSYRYF